jgi:hypothetical protein
MSTPVLHDTKDTLSVENKPLRSLGTCPQCHSPLHLGRNEVRCTNCGRTVPDHPVLVAARSAPQEPPRSYPSVPVLAMPRFAFTLAAGPHGMGHGFTATLVLAGNDDELRDITTSAGAAEATAQAQVAAEAEFAKSAIVGRLSKLKSAVAKQQAIAEDSLAQSQTLQADVRQAVLQERDAAPLRAELARVLKAGEAAGEDLRILTAELDQQAARAEAARRLAMAKATKAIRDDAARKKQQLMAKLQRELEPTLRELIGLDKILERIDPHHVAGQIAQQEHELQTLDAQAGIEQAVAV